MTKLARLRFSLATLMLVLLWSAVVLGIVTASRDELLKFDGHEVWITYYGWPWVCAVDERSRIGPSSHHPAFVGPWCWRLIGDAVVGLLLVAVLTWGSWYLWRHWRLGTAKTVHETMARHYYVVPWYWRAVGDAVVVVLLVVVLTWGSGCLWRYAKLVLRSAESPPPAAASSP